MTGQCHWRGKQSDKIYEENAEDSEAPDRGVISLFDNFKELCNNTNINHESKNYSINDREGL